MLALEVVPENGPHASSSTLMRSLVLDEDEETGLVLVSTAGLIENKSTSFVSSRLAMGGLLTSFCFGETWAAGAGLLCLSPEFRRLAASLAI